MQDAREQALKVLHGEVPDYTPLYFSSCQILPFSGNPESPAFCAVGQAKDAYGCTQVMSDGAWTVDSTVSPVIDDIAHWRDKLVLPKASDVDWEAVVKADYARFKPDFDNRVVDMIYNKGIFERMHFLMGFEQTMVNIMIDPEEMAEFARVLTDVKVDFIDKMLTYYKPDVLTFMDDYAFKDNIFMSLDTFREIFKPQLVRVVDCIHEHGVIAKLHCCGKMQALTQDYIELGADVLDPVQPANDIPAMFQTIRESGRKLGISGGMDAQYVVDRVGATEEEIRAEIRRCLESYAGYPFMIYGASIHIHDPKSYAPDGCLGIAIDEHRKYIESMMNLQSSQDVA